MAKANGIIQIEGTVDKLTFFKRDGKSFVRQKGGVSKERIASDQALAARIDYLHNLLAERDAP